jgi:hypothetical protein
MPTRAAQFGKVHSVETTAGHATRLSWSTAVSQAAIWFQLGGMRDANPKQLILRDLSTHPNVCSNLIAT